MTDAFREAQADLARMLTILQPWMPQLVLVGGFATWMYRYVDAYRPPKSPPLLTLDVDWAAELGGLSGLSDALQHAGFVAKPVGGTHPAVTRIQHVRWEGDVAPVFAEFLVPMVGPDRGRTVRVLDGPITGQALRYMDLALDEPVLLDASAIPVLEVPKGTFVRLPHPAHYVVHKALTARLRPSPQKRWKDLAYIYEVALMTQPVWMEMQERVQRLTIHRGTWLARAVRHLEQWFGTADSPGCAAVCDVLNAADPNRRLTHEQVHRGLAFALPAMGLSVHGR